MDGVYVQLDQSVFHSPSHALLIQFSAKQNLYYRDVYQYVKVSPHRAYRLQAFVRAEDITSDGGLGLEAIDVYNPSSLDKFSEQIFGTIDTWRTLTLDFETGTKTELIIVRVVRLPSHRLNSLLSGKLWLDDVRLSIVPGSNAMPPR